MWHWTRKLMEVSVFSLLVFVGAAGGTEFFSAAADRSGSLPADGIYPRGRLFPFSGFQPSDVSFYRAHHFTLCGPAYGGNIPRMLKAAKSQGVSIVYPITARFNGRHVTLDDLSNPQFRFDEKAIAEDLTRQVGEAVRNYPTIAWWYLQPEELRFWRKNEYRYLQLASAAIREADPLKRPVWMYNPGHYLAGDLAKYAPYLDLLGKGMYTNNSGFVNCRVWVRHSCESMHEAIRLSRARAVPIAVPEMFINPPPDGKGEIAQWVRHDVYLALLCGCKGIVVFSLAERPTMAKDVHARYQKAYLQIAEELNGKPRLGQVFLFGEPRGIIQGRLLAGPTQISGMFRKKVFTYSPIMFREYNHVSGQYLFAVNSAHEEVTYRFGNLPKVNLALADAVSGREILTTASGHVDIGFKPLEVKLYTFTRK